jgi:hypothetical protein
VLRRAELFDGVAAKGLDCFAALAMTARVLKWLFVKLNKEIDSGSWLTGNYDL